MLSGRSGAERKRKQGLAALAFLSLASVHNPALAEPREEAALLSEQTERARNAAIERARRGPASSIFDVILNENIPVLSRTEMELLDGSTTRSVALYAPDREGQRHLYNLGLTSNVDGTITLTVSVCNDVNPEIIGENYSCNYRGGNQVSFYDAGADGTVEGAIAMSEHPDILGERSRVVIPDERATIRLLQRTYRDAVHNVSNYVANINRSRV